MKYSIQGEPFPVVICELENRETMITERGSMCWMTPNMKMETTSGGGLGKMFGRMVSGEAMFQNRYTAEGGPGLIAFASSFPGTIRQYDITPSKGIVVQKSAFLAAETGVELSLFFQKRLGTAFFGGEGYIMQRLSGNGTAFVEIDGHAVEYRLEQGQSMIIDTGYLAVMDETCSIDIVTVPGMKNKLFGGEGIFNTVVTGPGNILLQTQTISAVAGALRPFLPSGGN
ncbi:MAG: TIGR00266 family protein [Clostridiales bacterium]